jgi:hypothetical protein
MKNRLFTTLSDGLAVALAVYAVIVGACQVTVITAAKRIGRLL